MYSVAYLKSRISCGEGVLGLRLLVDVELVGVVFVRCCSWV